MSPTHSVCYAAPCDALTGICCESVVRLGVVVELVAAACLHHADRRKAQPGKRDAAVGAPVCVPLSGYSVDAGPPAASSHLLSCRPCVQLHSNKCKATNKSKIALNIPKRDATSKAGTDARRLCAALDTA
jgi:hypothetical protein